MHIERERENMKRRLTATAGQQATTGQPSTSFKSVSLQPPSSQASIPARRPSVPNQPVASTPAPKRDLKLTVSNFLSLVTL